MSAARKALERILEAVRAYLPPDGIDAKEAMSRVIAEVDPWPLKEGEPEIQEVAEVWIAWTNTDLTEGRGYQKPLAVCWHEATAIRMGQRGYVMGGDCPVSKAPAIRVGNRWLVPSEVHQPTPSDEQKQRELDARRLALDKARAVGLTEADLRNLGVQQ